MCRPGKVIFIVLCRRLAQPLPHVAGNSSAVIWKVELREGKAVPRALKPPNVAVAVQNDLNM